MVEGKEINGDNNQISVNDLNIDNQILESNKFEPI